MCAGSKGSEETVVLAPQVKKLFFIINSAEHEIFLLINVKMPTIVGISTYISMINSTSERLKASNYLFVRILVFICS